ADAEPLLLQGYEGMKQREAKIPVNVRQVRLTEALERLVQLYDAWDKKDQAVEWRTQLIARAKTEPKKPIATAASAVVVYNRGNALREAKKLDEAIAAYKQALAIDP